MKPNLQTFPKESPYDRANSYTRNVLKWKRDFEKELQQLDTNKWLDEHMDDMFENYPPIRDAKAFKFEDMLRYFIKKEILGIKQ